MDDLPSINCDPDLRGSVANRWSDSVFFAAAPARERSIEWNEKGGARERLFSKFRN